MSAFGYWGLAFLALSIQWGLLEEQIAASFFAFLAVIFFSICVGVQLVRGNII